MRAGPRDSLAQMAAWTNYRARLEDTLSLLNENLEDTDDQGARAQIARLIDRHYGYLRRAERRIDELSRELAPHRR
jgi:hypothetical protein